MLFGVPWIKRPQAKDAPPADKKPGSESISSRAGGRDSARAQYLAVEKQLKEKGPPF